MSEFAFEISQWVIFYHGKELGEVVGKVAARFRDAATGKNTYYIDGEADGKAIRFNEDEASMEAYCADEMPSGGNFD